jgi:hypothetical protein
VGVRSSAPRIRAVKALLGHLSVQTLENYRAAGSRVYRELDDAERLRRELIGGRTGALHLPPAAAGRLLCIWNAYVLQTLGEHVLDAVHPFPGEVLHPVTSAQVLTFLGPVERWISQARQAATDVAHRVEEHVYLPAEPPAWIDVESGPHDLLAAMVTAGWAIHARGRATLADYAYPSGTQRYHLDRLERILDRAADAIDHAVRARVEDHGASVSTPANVHLRYAVRMLYMFGQFAAMPHLFQARESARVASLVARVPAAIDPWCLTDPNQRDLWQALPAAGAAIQRLWAADSYPMATVRIQAQIDAALRNSMIVFAVDRSGQRLGSFYRCPWSAIYEVREPVTIGGTRLLPMQHFTYDVVGEAHGERMFFARRIVVSVFAPADAIVSTDA